MGADRGILVKAEGNVEPLAVAKILKAIVDEKSPGLVILAAGDDDDSNQTGQMLAALLGWSQTTFASKVEVDVSDFNVTRESTGPADGETEGRLRNYRLAAQRARYASLPNIMKAREADRDKDRIRLRRRSHGRIWRFSRPPSRRPQGRRQRSRTSPIGVEAQERSRGFVMTTLPDAEHDTRPLKIPPTRH